MTTTMHLNSDVLRQRHDGVSVTEYAESLAERELLLDRGNITARRTWLGLGKTVVEGDTEWVMSMLEGLARRYRVPYVAGDFDRTNRIESWDRQIQSDPATRETWREVYAIAVVKMSNLMPESDEGLACVERVKNDEVVLTNALLPIAKRRANVTSAIKQARDAAAAKAFVQAKAPPSAPPNASAATPPSAAEDDPVLFPGERLCKLSDFVRLQRAAMSGDFMGALAREGIDPGYYGTMSVKLAHRIQSDPALAMRQARMMMRA
jgi:hypothetical protein